MICIKFLSILTLLLAALPAHAQPNICTPKNQADISSTVATAAALANITNKQDSLKYKLNEIITKDSANLLPQKDSYLLLNVVPNKFKETYTDQASCQQLLDKTTAMPLRYENLTFDTKESLIDWFYNFTQGKGRSGKDLYQRCPGSCSPQYTARIHTATDKYILDISVVCGHARDKWENNYQLRSFLSSSCSQSPNPY